MRKLETFNGTHVLVAVCTDPEAYEAERQALIAEIEEKHGAGGTFRANVSDDFNRLDWIYQIRTVVPAEQPPLA